jgi:hypothetical protein
MTLEVSLRIAINVQPPHHPLPLNRNLPDSRPDRLPAPYDFPWPPHVKRKKPDYHLRPLGLGPRNAKNEDGWSNTVATNK